MFRINPYPYGFPSFIITSLRCKRCKEETFDGEAAKSFCTRKLQCLAWLALFLQTIFLNFLPTILLQYSTIFLNWPASRCLFLQTIFLKLFPALQCSSSALVRLCMTRPRKKVINPRLHLPTVPTLGHLTFVITIPQTPPPSLQGSPSPWKLNSTSHWFSFRPKQ